MLRELHNSPIGLFRPALALARPNTLLGPLGGIDHSDLHHIYHHLRSGCILQLQPVQGLEHQHLFFQASYGGLNLGVLSRPLADRILKLEADGRPYRVTVAEVVREKYLPPTAVHVLLEWGMDD